MMVTVGTHSCTHTFGPKREAVFPPWSFGGILPPRWGLLVSRWRHNVHHRGRAVDCFFKVYGSKGGNECNLVDYGKQNKWWITLGVRE
jgi:hypothetical protein